TINQPSSIVTESISESAKTGAALAPVSVPISARMVASSTAGCYSHRPHWDTPVRARHACGCRSPQCLRDWEAKGSACLTDKHQRPSNAHDPAQSCSVRLVDGVGEVWPCRHVGPEALTQCTQASRL